MATSLISPGVEVREIDLTTIVPNVSTTEGVIAGVFRWGPINERVLVDSETNLVNRFGKPTNLNPETFFTAASFLAYGNKLYVTRVANTSGSSPSFSVTTDGTTTVTVADTTGLVSGMEVITTGATTLATGATVASVINTTAFTVTDVNDVVGSATGSVQFLSNTVFSSVANSGPVANVEYSTILNETDWDNKEETIDTDVKFIAKWPGRLGNTLRVSICANTTGFSSNVDLSTFGSYAELAVVSGSNTAILSITADAIADASANQTAIQTLLNVTDLLTVGNTVIGEQKLKITEFTNAANTGTANVAVTVDTVAGNTTVTTTDTTGLIANMIITSGDATLIGKKVASVTNSTSFEIDSVSTYTLASEAIQVSPVASISINFEDKFTLSTDYKFQSSVTATKFIPREWEFANLVDVAPGQSDFQREQGNTAANDEMHLVVTDNLGRITGVPGTILERYDALSIASNAKTVDGGTNYYRTVINENSQFVWAANDPVGITSNTATNVATPTLDTLVMSFILGRDGANEENIEVSSLTGGYELYKSKEDVEISLVLQGKARGTTLANYLIQQICEPRMDCIALISPQKGDVVNNLNNETAACVTFRNSLPSSSYGVMDSGYKYMYDRYNDINRWVPLNGDVTGLMVRTDRTNDPWFSPAGYNRGIIKNVIRLAWNPRQAFRDELYKNGINPIVTFPGQGTLMFGDKTLLAKPSAFDRINVRRLFIVLEKAISEASKYSLFEFNDEFTRLQFKNLVVPYLRDVKGRRGITDFLVVADGTNNTPEVIDRNEFVGDIYIKPARSINFIQLNFVAVRTGVAFSEITGKF